MKIYYLDGFYSPCHTDKGFRLRNSILGKLFFKFQKFPTFTYELLIEIKKHIRSYKNYVGYSNSILGRFETGCISNCSKVGCLKPVIPIQVEMQEKGIFLRTDDGKVYEIDPNYVPKDFPVKGYLGIKGYDFAYYLGKFIDNRKIKSISCISLNRYDVAGYANIFPFMKYFPTFLDWYKMVDYLT